MSETTTNEVIHIEYITTLDEALKADRYYWRAGLRQPYRFLLYLIACTIMAATGTAMYQDGFSLELAIAFSLTFYLTFLLRFFFRSVVKRKFLTHAERNKPLQYEVSAECIKIYVEGLVKGELSWDCFTKLITTPEGLFFVASSGVFNWIPYYAFKQPQDIETLIQWAKQHVREYQNIGGIAAKRKR